MTSFKSTLIEHKGFPIFVLLIVSTAAYIPFLEFRDFWAPVEPRYAEITRVLWERGEWALLRVNGEPYADKPVLFFWLALILSKVAGEVSELTMRLPSSLAAVGLVLVTYLLVREFLGKERAFLSGLVLGTSLRVVWEARWTHTDLLLSFFTTLAMFLFLRAFYNRGSDKQYFASYAMMGLATLTKGLIGFVLPGLVILTFLFSTRSLSRIRDLRIPTGTLVFLLPVLPWIVAVTIRGGTDYWIDFLWVQHLQRYLDPKGHVEPFYYYFLNLPADLVPWALYIPGAVAFYIKKRDSIMIKDRTIFFFLLVWIGVIFLFFTFTSQKRSLYLLPIFPPIAALLSGYLSALQGSPIPPPLARSTKALNLAFFGLLALSSIIGPFLIEKAPYGFSLSAPAFWIFLLVVSILAIGYLLYGRWFAAYVATGALMVGVSVILYGQIFPAVNPLVSPRSIGEAVRRIVPANEPLWIYKDTMTDVNFYARRERIPVLTGKDELSEELERTGRGYLLVKGRNLDEIKRIPSLRVRVLAQGAPRGKKWRLLRVDQRP